MRLKKETKKRIDDIFDLYDLVEVKKILEMMDEKILGSEEIVIIDTAPIANPITTV